AVFNKATSHTKAMLQKTEEEKRTLEKHVQIISESYWNSLCTFSWSLLSLPMSNSAPEVALHPFNGGLVMSCCRFVLFPQEINILQWEIEFDQDRFKNIEDTWTEKYDRIYCENAALKEALKLRTEEVKTLKAENAILNQQCLEFLAMLDVKQQKVVQENMSLNKSDITDFTGLEVSMAYMSFKKDHSKIYR
ncbi:hypothetical protein Q9233_011649, partial [Columba guinea]